MNNISEFNKINIIETLKEVKKLIENNDVIFQSSVKNVNTMKCLRRELGITYEDFQDEVIDKIKELTIDNYCDGPCLDHNETRDLIFWIFGIKVFEKEIYLKFDIREENGKKVILWSYHFPEYKMNYPFVKVKR